LISFQGVLYALFQAQRLESYVYAFPKWSDHHNLLTYSALYRAILAFSTSLQVSFPSSVTLLMTGNLTSSTTDCVLWRLFEIHSETDLRW